MDADHYVSAPFDALNHGIVRRNRRIEGLRRIDAALFEQLAPSRVVKRRIRRGIQLNIGRALVDQRLDFVAHDRSHVLKHVVDRRINLVADTRPIPAHGMLHRGGRADFERSRRMLLQKRRFAGREAAFLAQFCADDKLEIAFLRLFCQFAASAAPFEAHRGLAWDETFHGLGDVSRKNVPAVFTVRENLDSCRFLQLERFDD